jgi:hypothetical protein
MVTVHELDLGLRPDRSGREAQDSSPAAEIDDALWRLVPDITCQRLDQCLTACIQSFCAEDPGTGFDAEDEMLATDRFDGRLESRCFFGRGTRTGLLPESHDPRPRSIGDDDWFLVQLFGKAFHCGDHPERIRPCKEKLAFGLEDSPGVLKVEKGGGTTLLQVDQHLAETFVFDFARAGDDVQIGRFRAQVAVSPGLDDGSALGDDHQIGLELANLAVA